jgi:hypothetical protein
MSDDETKTILAEALDVSRENNDHLRHEVARLRTVMLAARAYMDCYDRQTIHGDAYLRELADQRAHLRYALNEVGP